MAVRGRSGALRATIRLLRAATTVVGLAFAAWLVAALFTTATAAADPVEQPADPASAGGGGLLGGLTSGLTSTIGAAVGGLTDTGTGVVNGATTTVTGLTGAVTQTAGSVIGPEPSDPQQPAPIITLPHLPTLPGVVGDPEPPSRPDPVPVGRPEPVAPAPVVQAAAPAEAVRRAVLVQQPVAEAAAAAEPSVTGRAGDAAPSGPVEVPLSPAAPVAPGSMVTPMHDSAGQAKGLVGLLPWPGARHSLDASFSTRSRAADVAGRPAGLPATSPD